MRRKLYLFGIVCAGFFGTFSACRNSASNIDDQIPDTVSYNFNIRPILSDKCYKCHGPDASKRQAGLRLDQPGSAFKALRDNPHAHILVPGSPEMSELFRRVSTNDTSEMMPPANSNLKRLTPHELDLIKKWIKQGAKYEKHWAFVPPKLWPVPQVKDKAWPKNPIDNFILHKQEQYGVKPNPEADKEHLLKRLSLDLTGLPPSLEMMDRFTANKSPDAYNKVVDELMKSPAYGEKMALHWMDVARFADSHGYQDDNYRTQWPWRDWVIHAFNENLPYDKFITWQLAGDLMPNATKEQLLATAFNRNHKITEEGGVIDEEYRVAYVTDRTNTFGKALLGVTIECAHCHDHKYDPFSQKEYYQLFSFFNSVKEAGLQSTVGGPETYAKRPLMQITNDDVKSILKFINKQDTGKLIVSVMGDSEVYRKTFILKRGNYDTHGDEVVPGTPKSILPFDNTLPKNRLGLAEWLFSRKNPLAARVFVNQTWQEIFGKGIVKSSGDFGMQGDLPSHPELLDWLAVDFMDHGWDMKRLVKQMVTSATYRQSAVLTADKMRIDPDNTLLSRGPRYRLPAELVRDLVLSSSGLLTRTIGGPSVNPYQPPGLWENATSGRGILASYKQVHGPNLYR
ncbi:MAG: PSD1 and planctomycete cytochrome C domain-containing protein, partial [Mucilaginibacter sp.]